MDQGRRSWPRAAASIIAGADTKELRGGTVLVNNGTATWGDLGNI